MKTERKALGKNRNRFVSMAILAILLFSWVAPVGAAEANGITRLGKETLSPEQKYVYGRMVECVAVLEEEIQLDQTKNITEQDLMLASRAFCSDYPEFFWYLGNYEFSYTQQGVVTKLMPQYTLNGKEISAGQEIEDAKAALKSKADDLLKDLPDGVYQLKEFYLHDVLAETVSYEKGSNDQTAYGALVDGKAVCAGYTRAYQYLLNLIGFSSWKIDGTAVNAQGQIEEHSWNLVIVPDFGCSYTDVTWDDQGENIYHAYLNRSLTEISEDHTTAEWQVPFLPECNHRERDYFNYYDGENGGACWLIDKLKGEDVAANFKMLPDNQQGSVSMTCSIWYTGENFEAWLSANSQSLAEALGFVGVYQCQYTKLSKEYCLTLTGHMENPDATMPTENPGMQASMPDLSYVVWIIAGAGAMVVIVVVALVCSGKKKK